MTSTGLETAVPVAARLRTALGLTGGAAILTAVGAGVGVADVPPRFTSWPLLALLAFLPMIVAGTLLARGRPMVAAAVLVAVAAFVPGRLLSDLQIARDTMAVSRPELLAPPSLAAPSPSLGLWLLIAGHLVTLAAGVVAASRPSVPDEQESSNRLVLVLLIGAVAAIALLGKPFTSSDPLLLARGAWNLPLLGFAGGLLLAATVPLAAAMAASSADADTRRGGLIGVALGLTAVAAPPLAAGLLVDRLGVAWGPVTALVAAALFLFVRPDGTVAGETDEPTLPGATRMHAVAGVIGILAGAVTAVGALTPQFTVPAGLTTPENYAAKLVLPAGVAVAILAACLLARGIARTVRPAFLVSLAALPLTVAGAIGTVVTGTQRIGAVEPGPGVWFMAGGVALAAVAAVCGAIAGAIEREDAEPERAQELPLPVLAAAFVAALLGVGAFALPALRAPDFVAPGLFTDFRVASWGLLIGLLAVLVAVGLALKSRPVRATALFCGAAVVVGVRLLELPLTGARAADAVAGPGTWLAAATVVALLIAAGARATRR
ncbi:hypothetical protein Lesp02_25920 [Lentzea sp. NBRC 105346]|uniref:hypothetical protein n=1 Tax=Lentzea sp. NBRC 105346 TaxID=3032205 RepID=UPI002553C9DD|nr:hypothetical protein [Lentzea sp. NBRC 105346]GLZ30403.1 hypothetical protein Lesp02_25920 [Lentzea sp. NBRC 105346]